MATVDQRTFVGGSIETKAVNVTSLAECSRRYGSLAKSKMVPGVVFQVTKERNPNNGRSVSYVMADYFLGGGVIKRIKLTTRSIRSTESTPAHDEIRRVLLE